MNDLKFKLMRNDDFSGTIKLVLQDYLYDDLIYQFGEEQIVSFLDAVISNSLNKIRDRANKGDSLEDGARHAVGYIMCEYSDRVNNIKVQMKLTSIIVKVLRCYESQYSEAKMLAYQTISAPNFCREHGIYTEKY